MESLAENLTVIEHGSIGSVNGSFSVNLDLPSSDDSSSSHTSNKKDQIDNETQNQK